MPVFRLLVLSVFRHAEAICYTVDSSAPSFNPIGAGVRVCATKKNVNCTKFWNISAPQERILCATLTKLSGFMGGSMSIEVSNLAGFAEGVQVLWEFNVGGVFFPKFSASPNGETMRPI